MSLPTEEQWQTYTGYLGPKSKATTEKLYWSNEPVHVARRQRSCDIIKGAPPTSRVGLAKIVKSEEEAFNLFFDDNIINLIVSETNKHIDNIISNLPEHISSSDKYPYIKRVN